MILRESVERASSIFVGLAEEAKNRMGVDRSVRLGSVEEGGVWNRVMELDPHMRE